MKLPSRRIWVLAAATLVVAAGVAVSLRYHVVERLLRAEPPPTFEVKKGPFARRISADGYLRAVKATRLTAPAEAEGAQKIAWLAPDGSKVSKGDLVARFDPSEYEKKKRDGEADRSSADAKIEKERVLTASALKGRGRDADLSQAELEKTKAFPQNDPEIFSRNQIIESGIDQELSVAKWGHATDARGIEGALSKSKVDLIAVEKRSAEQRVKQATQGLASLEVRAPHDGIVVFEADNRGNLPHVGDSVYAGQAIASLPLLDEMEAEVFVLEADASGLSVGVVAKVLLEAHPEPVHDAKIKRIDTLAKPRLREVPIQYFGATLELAKTDRLLMKPGERVHATLLLDKADAIAVPRQSIFQKDGKTIVYRWRNDAFEPATVKQGASSPGLVVIEEGLADGDKIALRDPTVTIGKPASSGEAAKAPGAR